MYNNEKELKLIFEILLCIESYHFWKIVVNNVDRSWAALVTSVFPNTINYFIFKNFYRRLIYFSWKNIWEWKILKLVLFDCCSLAFSISQRF